MQGDTAAAVITFELRCLGSAQHEAPEAGELWAEMHAAAGGKPSPLTLDQAHWGLAWTKRCLGTTSQAHQTKLGHGLNAETGSRTCWLTEISSCETFSCRFVMRLEGIEMRVERPPVGRVTVVCKHPVANERSPCTGRTAKRACSCCNSCPCMHHPTHSFVPADAAADTERMADCLLTGPPSRGSCMSCFHLPGASGSLTGMASRMFSRGAAPLRGRVGAAP